MKKVPFKVVIPARYASTRFPGKPLAKIFDKPMIEIVYQNALQSYAAEVIVATDSALIMQTVSSFSGNCLLTSQEHTSGTERIIEVINRKKWHDDDIVVNLQGDEPLMPANIIAYVAYLLHTNPKAEIATIGTSLTNCFQLDDTNIVKLTKDHNNFATLFSRTISNKTILSIKNKDRPNSWPIYKHIGIYAYKVKTLKRYGLLKRHRQEAEESLEQLRALKNNMKILVGNVQDLVTIGVDSPKDLKAVSQILGANA